MIMFFATILAVMAGANVLDAAQPTKPLILKFAIWMPAHVSHGRAAGWLLKDIEKKSQGRIKIEYYWANSLVPMKQLIDAVQKGVADIAGINPAYQPGKMPLLTVNTLPATSPGEYYPSAKALQELIQMPEIKSEIDKLNMRYLGPLPTTAYGVWSKKPVRRIEDLKGLKLRAIGLQNNLLDAVGGVPISMGSTEVYQAIAKGTLDGGLANPAMAIGYKWQEVTNYYYPINFGCSTMFIAVNKNSWKKIPPDIQKRFAAVHDISCGVAHQIYQGDAERLLDLAVAQGQITVNQPSPEDKAKITKVAKEKIWKDWVEKMNKKGLPGQKVLDRWVELLAKWHGESPFK